MKPDWSAFKNILVIRPDNMGDLLMSGPAIRALKETYEAKITVLTSSMATPMAKLMKEINEVITFDFSWVKNQQADDISSFGNLIEVIRYKKFDAAVIFTVYSQNPMPSIMLAYMAGVPNRLAYCRENPYQLLTHWVPDEEPYTFIRHQVRRDLDLVAQIGAHVNNEKLYLQANTALWPKIENKLIAQGFDPEKKWLIIHAGVSEVKREFPTEIWAEAAKKLIAEEGFQIILTGSKSETELTDKLQNRIGNYSLSTGGLFNLDELVTLVSKATVMLSVNTGTVHIAAAVGTPVVVLYALTNPQHTPWKVPNQVLHYQINDEIHSRNEVIRYVNRFFYLENIKMPDANAIFNATRQLMNSPQDYLDNELFLVELMQQGISLG